METNDFIEEMLEEIEKVPQNSPESVPAVNNQVGGPNRAPHSNAVVKSQRIEEIADMLLHHKSNSEIKKHIAEKYGISPNTVKDDITDANKLIIEQIPEIKAIVAKNIDTYTRIIRDSESDDKRTSILAMAGLEKLLRLHGPETQNNTQINLKFDNVDTQELIELIKSISNSGGK